MLHPSTNPISRRQAIKTLGAGAAIVSLGKFSLRAADGDGGTRTTPPALSLGQPFSLPALGYAYDALEPHIDARTMEIHHTKHHQAYITNANKALSDQPRLQSLSATQLLKMLPDIPEAIRTTVRNNVGGHVNHSFFWQVIAPGGGEPDTTITAAITKAFGSMDGFKTQFAEAAMKRFGSGWAWLSVKNGALQVHSTANQDSPLSEGAMPVLGLDVWEHAYYLNYQNRRADYVAAFWRVVNWRQAGVSFAQAVAAA